MPSTSAKQARLMRAAAHGWKKPGGGGPSQSVAKEFVAADKKRGKFGTGGRPAVNNPNPNHGKLNLPVYKAGKPMRKPRRKFAEGGLTGWSTSVSFDEADAKRRADEYAASRKPSFKSAFASARGSGAKDFEWNGKKYSTELASSKPSVGAMKPSSGGGSGVAKPSTASKPVAAPVKSASISASKVRGGKPMAESKKNMTMRDVRKKADPYESNSGWRKLAARFGTTAQRKKYSAEGYRYAKGGSVDGCAVRGKTKGKMK